MWYFIFIIALYPNEYTFHIFFLLFVFVPVSADFLAWRVFLYPCWYDPVLDWVPKKPNMQIRIFYFMNFVHQSFFIWISRIFFLTLHRNVKRIVLWNHLSSIRHIGIRVLKATRKGLDDLIVIGRSILRHESSRRESILQPTLFKKKEKSFNPGRFQNVSLNLINKKKITLISRRRSFYNYENYQLAISELSWLIRHTSTEAFLLSCGPESLTPAFVDHCLGDSLVRISGCLLQDYCLSMKKSSIAVRTISVFDFIVGVLACRSTAPQSHFSDCLFACVHLNKFLS